MFNLKTDVSRMFQVSLFKYIPLSAKVLTLQDAQTLSNNSLAAANELFECVWPSCGAGA